MSAVIRLRSLFAACLLLSIAVAAPARGATTIGDTTTPVSAPGGGPIIVVQATDPSDASYAVPAGGGVITSVAATTSNPTTFLVVRPGGAASYTVVGTQALTAPASMTLATASTRIPVEAGDRLGIFVPSGSGTAAASDPVAGYATFAASTAPTSGQTLSSPDASGLSRVSLSATVEPDADHDGYGDETQDSCPSNPAIHVGPCATDLSVRASVAQSTIAQDDVTTITAPISASDAEATDVTATLSVPGALAVVAAVAPGGDCENGPAGYVCPVGDIAAGHPRKVYLVVRGANPGAWTVGVSVRTPVTDTDPQNDSASVGVTVTTPPASGGSPQVPSDPGPKLCTVPSLKGKTAAAARTALTKAGCAAGKATGSKARKAKVRSQTIPAGVQVLAGTKVGYGLKAPAVKRKAPKKR
ncbi:MAG TPA: PASTA domain-containing protein [Baekduia sp.]|uniref:PASTA domain-containing protein n=1 Tax=Baekduia sp. TaxID=2600305 RepID=UPI002D797ACF|nr:PASTA domain-containing protein [Baekduia sp.]HET6509581.1 PASTA domain-containing protein [Baekduia sp.]